MARFVVLAVGLCTCSTGQESRHLASSPEEVAQPASAPAPAKLSGSSVVEDDNAVPNTQAPGMLGQVAAAEASDGADEPTAEVSTPSPAKPIATYLSKRTTVTYAEPAWGTTIRGRIDPEHAFHVYAMVPEGADCEGDGWAETAAGYVCLQRSRKVEDPVVQLPAIPEGQNTPYIYARPKQSRQGVLEAEVPVYRNKWGFYRQREPVAYLEARHQYAFVDLKRSKHGKFLVDADDQVVPTEHMQVFKPSKLVGRTLADAPIPEGLYAAWSVRRRAEVYDRPDLTRGKVTRRLDYHEAVEIRPAPVRKKGEVFELIPGAGRDGGDGYVLTADIRHYVPGPKRTDVGDDEVWVDVDVAQQVLAVMVGDTTEFVTLISSGSHKHPTPSGLYRVRYKLAYGKMESRDDADPDEVYYVEAVPWVLYFHNRYALHAAFWHNNFGRRRSHGCINLAPADARYVFERASPTLPPAFTSIHEREDEPGMVVRIRRGQDPVEDKRRGFKDARPDDDEMTDPEAPEADPDDAQPGEP